MDIIIETPLDSNPPTYFQNTRKEGGGAGAGSFDEHRKDGGALHLQLLHLARPTAAFLAVDAADSQR